ncbi:MAG: hypothetical protein EXS37_09370 [Opitutus sp.]|nr:hypothetical protein [Opitutus sp.]
MTEALNVQLDEVVRLKRTDAGAVLGDALREGMKQLYTDAVIEARLRGELTREQAVERLGERTVARAETEWQAVREDVTWGLQGRE